METVAFTMSDLLSSISVIFTQGMTNVGTIATTITDTPLLLMGAGMTIASFFIGVFLRLFHQAN